MLNGSLLNSARIKEKLQKLEFSNEYGWFGVDRLLILLLLRLLVIVPKRHRNIVEIVLFEEVECFT